MIGVNIFITNVSGERFRIAEKPIPSQIHINININVLGFEEKSDREIEAPFVFTVNYVPSIAQINIRGRTKINGERSEIDMIIDQSKKFKPPPIEVIQAVSNAAMADAILISKTLNVPPPLPPIPSQSQAAKKVETKYTA